MSILYTNGDNETDGGALELDGVSAITSADIGGTTYVFVAGGLDNGISVFSLGLNGALTNTANVTDSGALNLTGVSGLTTIMSDGNTYLVAAGATDNGLSVFRVNVGGTLTPVYDVADAGGLNLAGVSRVTSATVSGAAYVFAAGTNDDGISVFRVQGDGTLTSVSNLADNGTYELDGVKGLATAVIGGSTYLFAAGGLDDGLSVFSVAANGALTNTANVTDNGTLRLDGASDVATAVVGGTTYVFVTGANDNGVSVFSVNASGQLTNTANVGDSASLRLAGATGLSVNTFGTTTYLTVGGTESGVSLFRVNAGGTLTAMDNIDDGGSRELASGGGTTAVHSATVGGTNYVIAGGSVDDGVSTLGLKPTGQLWYATEGGDADTRIVRINNDGSSHTVNVDNGGAGTGDDHLISSFTSDIGLDTAAGFYFAILSSQNNDVAYLVRGVIGSSATPTTVVDFPDNIIVNTIEVDPINHRIYAGYQDGSGTPNGAITGIRVYSYNPLNGAVTDLGFLTTAATDNRANESGFYVLDPQDFALDSSIGRLFYTERVDGLVTGIYRLDLASPNTTTQLVSQAQFPDDQSGGIIMDVEVDESTNLVYFTTHSQFPSPDAGYNASQNAIWYIDESASSGTAVKVTLVGMPGGGVFYPGDMTFDQSTRQLYIENEETGSSETDDVIYVFQLNGAGTTATLINTITPNLTASGANIEGLFFSDLPVLSGLSGTATTMNEQQAAATTLLTGAPTITDTDGDHLASATVQITGGKFSSNESSTTDDHLGYGAAKQISGLVSGTNITLAWDASSETLTLTGYDTIANYQAVLAAITYWTTGDNPTNYGLNTNRTITWTVSDGTPDVPGGAVNSGTTTINIAAVNDAPVNGSVSSATGNEDASIAVTGLQISDVDANPALQTVSVTLSVTKGVLTLLTNVTNGLTSGQITGNGTDTITISASINAINATLAATNGLLFLGDANANGTDTLTVVTDDGGGTGSGGALSDTDNYTITIAAVNDTPVVPASATTVGATEQTPATLLGSLTVSDVDLDALNSGNGDYAGASFTVQRASANAADTFAFASGGLFTVSGGNLQVGGLTFATFTVVGGVLTISFTSSAATATTALVNDVLDHITYTNTSDAPPASVSLNYALNDGAPGGGQGSGATSTAGGSVTVNITAVNDVHTGGASITGTAAEDQVLTAVSTLADPDGIGTLHYQWQHDVGSGFVNVGADQATYTLGDGDIGGTVRVIISYTDAGGTLESATSAATASVAATNDAPTGGASITGTATEDQVLTADTSTLADSDGLGTLHYDWQRNTGSGFVSTGAADQATYTLGDADVGGTVRVVVSYTDGQGFANSVTSAATASIAGINDPHTGGASITGTAAENQVLTAVSTLADADGLGTLHYDWQRDTGSGFVSTGAADQATYTLGGADVGGTVRVVISYTDGQGFAESATSAATATIANVNDPHTGGVSITGTATENQVLTAVSTLADPDGLGTLHYDWQRDTGSGYVSIGAADQATYTLGDADVGGTVRVVVSYTDGQGTAESATSAGTAAIAGVNDPHTGGAAITGTATEDQVLTAVSTLADVDGLGTLHYDWQRNTGSGFVSTGAADQATYTLGDADVGGTVRVVISYTDGQGFAESATSAATATIANVNDPHTGGVSVTGTATENQVLTAVSTLADLDGLGTLHYDWQRDTGSGYVSIGAADQATYTLGDADVGGTVRVVVSYTDGQGTAESATSAGTAAIAGVNDPHTGGAAITGTATEDQVLTAVSTLADVDGLGTLHYDWQRNTGSGFVSTGAADQATYTLGDADVGGTVRVVISYTDGQGFAESATSAATATIANVNDSLTGGVSITGTAAEDQILTADTSTLADADGLGTLHYQWQSDSGSGFVNVGADQATYALGDGDIGAVIRVVVSYTDGHGTAETAFSGSTDTVVASNDPYTGGVTITGVATEDEVLTADTSTLADPDGLGALYYEWQRDTGFGFASVDGADQATYTLTDADVGAQIRVVVYYADGQGFFETVTSAATTPIANINDPHTGGAAITGTATENQVLTAVSTIVDDDGWSTLHYDWQRDSGSGFVSIGAADQSTYTLGDADVGAQVRVVISYTDDHGTAESSTSAATATVANVNDPHTGGAAITGTATENQVLTAVSTLADADGLGTLHYQWQRDSGSGFVNVGADQATYTLGDADVGGTVRVVVSYTDGQGTAESATSAGTAAIAGVNDPHTGGAAITGTATEDQVLTAVSTLADVDGLGTLHYDWQRNTGSGFVSIGAADQATYTLGDADVGGTVRVVVSYTDGQGFAESATSAATASIANVNDPHTGGVSVTGTTTENQVLTAASTLADADGLGALHYQWQRDSGSGFVNVGADQATYTLAAADIGSVIRVVTSYTDGHGTAESATSAATATILPANGPHTGGVSITGAATEDQVLTADTSSLADPGGLGAFHYQWQRSTTSSGYVNVGTDQATYTLGDADVGAQIRVIVSYTDGQGVFESETSGPTSAVANVNDAPTGTVTITGAATEDQVLTAASTLADVDGLGALHYQWQRDSGSGYVNVGSDQATYALGDADVGGTVRVVVSYTDGHGTAESKTSAVTAAVANVNDAPTAANDAGSVAQRLTLTGSVRTNDADIDNAAATLTVTNVAYNATHVDQAVVSGGTVVNGAYGKLTINPDGTYSYVADHEGLIVGQVVTDTFDYTIKDPSGASATAQLTVTVAGSATGDANANILISDGSAHTLTGKGGADTLTGGGGADVFAYQAIGDSTVAAFDTITDFTHGSDTLGLTPLITGTTKLTLSTDGTDKILSIDLDGDGVAEGQIKSLGQGLEVTDIVTGVANFGFTITGSSGGDTLTGGSGADIISGADGADSIRGGGGGDTLTGGAGVDTFLYGAGDSTSAHWDTITDFATGQDKLDISAVDAGTVSIARFGSSTFVYYGSGASAGVVEVSGDIKFTDLIVSGAVHGYTLYAGSGVETLTGSAGPDVLVGGSGSTTLNGGGGADILYGGTGNDTFQYTAISQSNFAGYDVIFGFDSGHDKVDISAIDGGKITIARYEGTTFIYSAPDGGGNSQAVVAVSGTSLKATDLVTSGGASQAFVLVGDGASHSVADTLTGAAGNDILYGLDGNDILTGAGGADFLLGGAGADTFVYTSAGESSPFATDLIFDFSTAQGDKLDLTGIDANSGTAANDAFSVVTAFSGAAGQVTIAAPDSSGYYHVSGDVNGDGVADFVIALNVTGTLTSADILL
ncbi:M10 family metallopeptidase C-terminal domain-containing protein [Caulobacter sp. BK020]|uniref:beta strand repeat-containing protein n=1 Tax=Caulobacter sp. BK020 TaxID=2512117 RepID=UPI001051F399|nr:M10 family metallopeptidase C-terminal domain-containing protein [Caulobacter sp. BK020]TCS16119.1 putative secreted protein (type I secretion substrate) [Caulobacter sp. BK020]